MEEQMEKIRQYFSYEEAREYSKGHGWKYIHRFIPVDGLFDGVSSNNFQVAISMALFQININENKA